MRVKTELRAHKKVAGRRPELKNLMGVITEIKIRGLAAVEREGKVTKRHRTAET